ncbi:hypothetical protein HZS_3120 [Henneguya salminicola]|nr:hypothetical protein HZS_3120 [Henneguya salminicola]
MSNFISAKIFKNNELMLKLKNGFVEIIVEENDKCVSFSVYHIESQLLHPSNSFCLKYLKRIDISHKKLLLSDWQYSIFVKFHNSEAKDLLTSVSNANITKDLSIFDSRTESLSAEQYFQFYSYLSQQQNMLCDRIRTESYQFAILRNPQDFKDKIILDVGTGTGILSFFAVFAGAKKVYAVEASSMAIHAKSLVDANNLGDKICVMHTKLENICELPPIDMIISEPMGYMLFNERMLETYVHARKFLAPGGNMFPTVADFWIVPFSDDAVYNDVYNKALFWYHKSFYGIDVTAVSDEALKEYFSQPIVDTFDARIYISAPKMNRFNFLTMNESDLHDNNIYLSTAPDRPLTHWYQVRLLFLRPLVVQIGDVIQGTLRMIANKRQSYNITLETHIVGVPNSHTEGKYDLKNCYLRCYTAGYFQQPNISYEPASVSNENVPDTQPKNF